MLTPSRVLAALNRRVRFRLWVLRTRAFLRRHRVELVIEGPRPTFDAPPFVQITRQHLVETPAAGTPRRLTLRFGANVHLGRGTAIELRPDGDNVLEVGEGSYFMANVRVLLFDGAVRLGRYGRVRDGVAMKSSGELVLGDHFIVQNLCLLHCARRVTLEERVTLAERVSVLDSDHALDGSDVYHQELPVHVDPVTIAENTLVGANAVILRGASVGPNSFVAASAVVRAGEYPAGHLLAGIPAEPVRQLGASVPRSGR